MAQSMDSYVPSIFSIDISVHFPPFFIMYHVQATPFTKGAVIHVQ